MGKSNAMPVPMDQAELRPHRKMSSDERERSHEAEREAIQSAQERMLAGRPAVVPIGELTVVALAREGRVQRAALTHRHTDLREDFEARREVVRRLAVLPGEVELRERLAECEAELVQARQAVRRWKAMSDDVVRIAHLHLNERDQLAAELERARRRLKRAKVFDLQ